MVYCLRYLFYIANANAMSIPSFHGSLNLARNSLLSLQFTFKSIPFRLLCIHQAGTLVIFQKTMFRAELSLAECAVADNADLRSSAVGECAGLFLDGHAASETKDEMERRLFLDVVV
jgi:hypothetical protein